jgi:hypothetical protein
MWPPFATHLSKKRRWSSGVPLLPAAGLPGSFGGKAFSSSAEHALATSAVMAGASVGWTRAIVPNRMKVEGALMAAQPEVRGRTVPLPYHAPNPRPAVSAALFVRVDAEAFGI